MAPRAIDLRSLPYVSKKSERTQQVVDEVLGSEGARRRRMFLVATSGPTSFVVKEAAPADEAAADDAPAPAPASPRGDVPASPRLEESPLSRARQRPVKHRVRIGAKHGCSCGGVDEKAGELCHHVHFVLLKVLRVPAGNPLAWQPALTDSELDSVLDFRARFERRAQTIARKHEYLRRRQGGGAGPRSFVTESDVAEGELAIIDALAPGPKTANAPALPTEEEMCPVCLDPLDVSEDGSPLTYCVKTCGNWVHVRCMIEYGERRGGKSARHAQLQRVRSRSCSTRFG